MSIIVKYNVYSDTVDYCYGSDKMQSSAHQDVKEDDFMGFFFRGFEVLFLEQMRMYISCFFHFQ